MKSLNLLKITTRDRCTEAFAVKNLIDKLQKLQDQYKALSHYPRRLFQCGQGAIGLDAIITARLLDVYEHEVKIKRPVERLMSTIYKSQIIPLVEAGSAVAGLLSDFFSYFPEFIPNELETRLNLRFSWIDDFALPQAIESKSNPVMNMAEDLKKLEKLTKPTMKTKEINIDEEFKKLEALSDDSDDDQQSIDNISRALVTRSGAESKKISDRLLTYISVRQSVDQGELISKKNLLSLNSISILCHALGQRAIPSERLADVSAEVVDKLLDYIKRFQGVDNHNDYAVLNILKKLTNLVDIMRVDDCVKVVEIYVSFPSEAIGKMSGEEITVMTECFIKSAHTLSADLLHKMTKILLKDLDDENDNDRLSVCKALAKVAICEIETQSEVKIYRNRRNSIIGRLLKCIKHAAGDLVSSIGDELRSIIPSMTQVERVVLIRKMIKLHFDKTKPEEISKVILKIYEVDALQKALEEIGHFGPDLSRMIVKMGM